MQKLGRIRILSFNLLQKDKDITSYFRVASTVSAVSEVKKKNTEKVIKISTY